MSAADLTASGCSAEWFAVSSFLTHNLIQNSPCISVPPTTTTSLSFYLTHSLCLFLFFLALSQFDIGEEMKRPGGSQAHLRFCCCLFRLEGVRMTPNEMVRNTLFCSLFWLSVSCTAVISRGGAAGQLFACQGLLTVPCLEVRP